MISRGGEDHLTLVLQHRGTARLAQDGNRVELRPGTFAVSDAGRPFAKELPEPFVFTAFHWPRSAVGVSEEELRTLTATVFDAGTGTARLAAAYLGHLSVSAESLEPQVASWLATTALDLLAVLAHERRGRSVPEAPGAALAILARVKDHIPRHLGDPDLTPDRIAAAQHVSVRYLHKLFRFEGVTVARWIQRRRLETCRRELARSTEGGRPWRRSRAGGASRVPVTSAGRSGPPTGSPRASGRLRPDAPHPGERAAAGGGTGPGCSPARVRRRGVTAEAAGAARAAGRWCRT